eukprot:5827018-Prymnesium_polylepis.1
MQPLARRRPVGVVGEAFLSPVSALLRIRDSAHLAWLQHEALAVEKGKVQLDRQVVVAHVECDALRANHPARQRAH